MFKVLDRDVGLHPIEYGTLDNFGFISLSQVIYLLEWLGGYSGMEEREHTNVNTRINK